MSKSRRLLFPILVMAVSTNMALPLFPLFEVKYHANAFTPISLFLIYLLMLVPTLLFAGPLGERLSPKALSALGMALGLVSASLFVSGTHLWMFYAARGAAGVSIGLFMGTANALLLAQNQQYEPSSVLKRSGVVTFVGFGLGPAISSLSLQYNEWLPRGYFPYWLLMAGLIVGFIEIAKIPRTKGRTAQPHSRFVIRLGIPREYRRTFWSTIGPATFSIFALNGAVMALVPVYVRSVMHSNNLAWPGLLLLMLLGGSGLSQLLPVSFSPKNRIRIGLTLLISGFWIMLLAGKTESIPLLWFGIAAQALGSGWVMQEALGLTGSIGDDHSRTRVLSTFWLVTYSGAIFPTLGIGLLTFIGGLELLTAMSLLAAIFTCVILSILAFSYRTDEAKRQAIDKATHLLHEPAPVDIR